MVRTGLTALILAIASCCFPLFGQDSSAPETSDLKLELRSGTGSKRFQLGEVIPLEALISSSTPNPYLEPCKMFWESCFGYPQCRYVTQWSFDVTPKTGWTDIGWHGCGAMSGPMIEVKSLDLALEAKKYPYTLTNRFRFDSPGTYTVRLSMTEGLDDDTNQLRTKQTSTVKPHAVSTTAEIVLEITPAEDGWKTKVIQQGVAAWTAPLPAYTNPPSPEYLKHQQQEDALCNLGTPEAALALVGLLSRGINVTHCLVRNSNKEVAQAEMRRLLVDPDVGVRPAFFAAYAKSLTPRPEKPQETSAVPPKVVNDVRDTLFASLPKKAPEAMILSLQTVLRNPMYGYWVVPGSAYDLSDPYSTGVIALTAADFDRLSDETRAALLDTDWEHVRSPLMLPVVRRTAQAGDGHALLRWLELDPVAATAFVRQEVIRPAPRFSSLYLRLPDTSLPGEEQQIAANFVARNAPNDVQGITNYINTNYPARILPMMVFPVGQFPAGVPDDEH